MRDTENVIDIFWAEDEKGNRYKIFEHQLMIASQNVSTGKITYVPSVKRYALEDGTHVNPYESDKFQIDDEDETILHRA